MKIEKPFHFVLGALQQYRAKIKCGCDIHIVSEFSDKVGLGSSAAVTVATLAALMTWLNVRLSPLDLVRQGREVVRQIQGVGSGADIAASIYGGMVGYQAQPLFAENFFVTHPLTALYAGFKTPTVDAIKQVQQHFLVYPNLFRHLTASIGQCAIEGIQLVRKENWAKLGEIMNVQQGLMESLGVGMPLLREMVDDLRKQPGMLGAKMSGSGLGDCVVGLGSLPPHYTYAGHHSGVQHIPIEMALRGVYCEKI
jgi:mevalonate kinase